MRQLYGQLTVGSEFQRRWMQEEWERLVQMTETLVAEESIEQLLQIGRTLEPASFRAEITRIEQEYDNVRRRLNSSTNGQRADLLSELDRLNRLLLTARTDYEQALARQRH
ncbi:MAG TPA: hypothetical protein DCL15_16830 [Chloroflexi bacterium]|nr:hypothetical protein [Chloroflexota bacterium]